MEILKRLLLVLLPFLLFSQKGSAEYFVIRDYDISVTITREGYADFVETIEVEFSEPRHGIIRFIPFRDEINGKRVDRILKDFNVQGYKYAVSKDGSNQIVKIGDANTYVEGRQVYKISYRVLNPLNFFEDNIEMYWDLLGTSWTTSIENVSFAVIFPEHILLSERDVRVFTGSAGQQGLDDTTRVDGNRITGHTTRSFMPGEGLTVAVNLPAGSFQPMDAMTSLWQRHWLFLPAIFFVIAGFVARFMARNKRQTIMTEYFPPEGISPAIAGGFVDHSVDSNDVLCLIPHLANLGYLRLEAIPGKGFFKKDNIIFYKLKDAGPDLMHFEAQFFNALFATGDLVELDDLKDKFYPHMASIKASVKDWIHQQGWYEADQKAFGCVTGLLALIALAWGAFAIFGQQNMDGIALGAAGFILLFFSSRFNKRSPAGNQTYQKLEGFRQFVAKAEKPVIERLMKEDPMYYDKTMAFALAFGYLAKWNKQFEGLLTQPPSWYTSPMMYGPGMHRSWSDFSESFPTEINNIGSVFSSSPSSNGSGGGGFGGGSSGGGSGGGGGSSW
jgi:uncharacterized membrane protein